MRFQQLLSFLLPCQHGSVSFPFRNVQRCFDCGRQRDYVLGGKPGKWRSDSEAEPVSSDSASVQRKDQNNLSQVYASLFQRRNQG